MHTRPVVETIGTRFGGILPSPPTPHFPATSFQMVRAGLDVEIGPENIHDNLEDAL